MKYAFIDFEKSSTIHDSGFKTTVTYFTDDSINYLGTDFGEITEAASIQDSAKHLFKLVKTNEIDKVIFNYPVVLKSKENPVEVGLKDEYIWKLKNEYKRLVSDQRDVENSNRYKNTTQNITITINGDFDSQKFLQKVTEEIKRRGFSAI